MIARSERQQRVEPARPVERERHLAPAERERLQHPGQAEEVVGVEVREEDLLEVDEADVRAQQLPLRPLAAVEEEPLAAAADERRRGRAARGRHRAGRAEEDHVEIHDVSLRSACGSLRQDEHLARDDRRPLEAVPLRISQTPSRGSA